MVQLYLSVMAAKQLQDVWGVRGLFSVPHSALSLGYLSVMAADQSAEKEVLEAESPGTASDLNRSDLDPIYIGGLPASRPIR